MKIGILGGGQLAWMLTIAAQKLGFSTLCLDPNPKCTASLVTEVIAGEYSDLSLVEKLAQQVDVVTIETENIPVASLQCAEQFCLVYPSVASLQITQDRLLEKNFLRELLIPTAAYQSVNTLSDLELAAHTLMPPLILKTRRLGYDGRGQIRLFSTEHIAQYYEALAHQELIVEKKLDFNFEVSQIVVRDLLGNISFYPLTKTSHQAGILRLAIAPWDPDRELVAICQQYAQKVVEALSYVGVLALEIFVCSDGVYANEIAPRVHNSGHWTIEGTACSQFENHIRAICELPLKEGVGHGFSAMINCVGHMPDIAAIQQIEGASLHDYQKSPRPQRKLGHVTVTASTMEALEKRIAELSPFVPFD